METPEPETPETPVEDPTEGNDPSVNPTDEQKEAKGNAGLFIGIGAVAVVIAAAAIIIVAASKKKKVAK